MFLGQESERLSSSVLCPSITGSVYVIQTESEVDASSQRFVTRGMGAFRSNGVDLDWGIPHGMHVITNIQKVRCCMHSSAHPHTPCICFCAFACMGCPQKAFLHYHPHTMTLKNCLCELALLTTQRISTQRLTQNPKGYSSKRGSNR